MSMNPVSKKIAMWSGPRNLSTAMMYSFAERNDTAVLDEPFYAAYLASTGIEHPMYQEVIAMGEINPDKVAETCTGANPQRLPVFYQKQMTKHMISSFDRDWIFDVTNVFLIRDPARVIASYHLKSEDPVLSDIGVKEQMELFDKICQKTGSAPTVINSADILLAPETMLRALCHAIDIEFQNCMLVWSPGPRTYDGVWGAHWYKSVWKSTGFAAPDKTRSEVPEHLLDLLETANRYYDEISSYALEPG
jgi:hypothetical protein